MRHAEWGKATKLAQPTCMMHAHYTQNTTHVVTRFPTQRQQQLFTLAGLLVPVEASVCLQMLFTVLVESLSVFAALAQTVNAPV